MHVRLAPLTALAAAAAMLLVGPTVVRAQGSESEVEQSQPAQHDYGQVELESFAAAALSVDDLRREWQPRIAQAENENEAKTLREEAVTSMVGAIEDEGLTVGEYNEIARAAQADSTLHQRIIELMQEMR